jgi:4-amino-4-deoxy-L-arabinose transferase-like glycosyltransferase
MYPFLIAALWWQDAPPSLQVRLVQVALGSIVAVLAYVMALEAFGLASAVIAGLAMALAPLSIYMTGLLLTETLFAFLMTVSVWFWTRRQGVLAGCFLGAATLTRAAALPLSGAVLLLGLLLKSDRRLNLKLGLVALAIVAPWTLRNAVTQGAFIPVANVGWGANLLFGTIDVPYGSGNEFVTFSQDPDVARIVAARPTPHDGEREMAAVAMARIGAAPLDWLWVRVKQYPRYWVGTGAFVSWHPAVKAAFVAGGIAFWLLVASGMFLARRRWRELYPLAVFPIVMSLAHFVGSAEERYSLGILPMAAIFAGYAVSVLVLRRKPASARPLTQS